MNLKSRFFLSEFSLFWDRGEKMTNKVKGKNETLELFEWMLAIDFDPAKYRWLAKMVI